MEVSVYLHSARDSSCRVEQFHHSVIKSVSLLHYCFTAQRFLVVVIWVPLLDVAIAVPCLSPCKDRCMRLEEEIVIEKKTDH